MASRAGHHIPGTPYTYKHGWKLVSEEQTHTLVSVPVDDVLRSFANQGFLWRNTEDRRQLADSMRQHGFDPANPINVSPDIGMVDGHHRLQAAKDAGLKEVPIAFHKTHMSSAEQSERDNGLAYGGDSFYRSTQRRARQDREERQRASSPAARIAAASRAIKRHHKAITFLEEAAARLDAANEHDRAKAARVDAEVERTQKSNHEKELKAAMREAMIERHKKRGQQYDMAVTPGGRVGDASPLARPGYKGGRKLSDYEREVAHALMRKGVPRRRAIIMARGIINKAAATGRWGKGKARPQVVAGAVASIAQRKAARVAHSMSADSGRVLDMAVLTTKKRKRLKKSQFALPAERKYPIPDRAHAANAKARVAQHGTPSQKKKVAAAVKAKFDMSTATVGELRRAAVAIKVAQARDIDLVGPKGYVHGWKFVGVPGGGVKIRRSRYGGSLAKTGARQRLVAGKSPNVTKDLKTNRTRGKSDHARTSNSALRGQAASGRHGALDELQRRRDSSASPKGSPTARLRKPSGLDAQMRDKSDGGLQQLSHHEDAKISMAARAERIRRSNLSDSQLEAERQARMARKNQRRKAQEEADRQTRYHAGAAKKDDPSLQGLDKRVGAPGSPETEAEVRRLIKMGVGERTARKLAPENLKRRGTVKHGRHAPLPAGRKVTAHELSHSGEGEIRDAETGEILSSGHKSKLAATRIANAHNAHYGYGSVGGTPNQHSGTDPLAKAKNHSQESPRNAAHKADDATLAEWAKTPVGREQSKYPLEARKILAAEPASLQTERYIAWAEAALNDPDLPTKERARIRDVLPDVRRQTSGPPGYGDLSKESLPALQARARTLLAAIQRESDVAASKHPTASSNAVSRMRAAQYKLAKVRAEIARRK